MHAVQLFLRGEGLGCLVRVVTVVLRPQRLPCTALHRAKPDIDVTALRRAMGEGIGRPHVGINGQRSGAGQ